MNIKEEFKRINEDFKNISKEELFGILIKRGLQNKAQSNDNTEEEFNYTEYQKI
jgi:hypothetical protein